MKFTLDDDTSSYRITAYEAGSIRINEETITNAVIISPDKTEVCDIDDVHSLTSAHFESLLDYSPEILILGTGSRQHFPAVELFEPVIMAGVGLEAMDTAAACRTYNILMSEGRSVVALLFMIE